MPDGPEKYQSYVTHLFVYCDYFLFVRNLLATSIGKTPVFLTWKTESIIIVSGHLCCTHFPIFVSSEAALIVDFFYLLFSLRIMTSKYNFLVASFIGDR